MVLPFPEFSDGQLLPGIVLFLRKQGYLFVQFPEEQFVYRAPFGTTKYKIRGTSRSSRMRPHLPVFRGAETLPAPARLIIFCLILCMTDELTIPEYLDRFFPRFEPSLKKKLAANCSVKHFRAGDILMAPGQYIRSVMLLVGGRVKLYRQGEEGEEFFMYYIEPGSACALSMICAARQETSVVMARAVEDTTALQVPLALMDELMKDHRSWYYFVLETYRNRYEELLTVIDHIAFKGMDERLEFYLKNQSEKLKTRQLKMTHQEIAGDLNSSREVISRLLKKMEQNGDVELHRNYIQWKK